MHEGRTSIYGSQPQINYPASNPYLGSGSDVGYKGIGLGLGYGRHRF